MSNLKRREFYVHRVKREEENQEQDKRPEPSYIISHQNGRQQIVRSDAGVGYHRNPKTYDFVRNGRPNPNSYNSANYGKSEEVIDKHSNEETIEIVINEPQTVKNQPEVIIGNRGDFEYVDLGQNNQDNDYFENFTIDILPEDILDHDCHYNESSKVKRSQGDSSRQTSAQKTSTQPQVMEKVTERKVEAKKINYPQPRRNVRYIPPKLDFLTKGHGNTADDKAEAERMRMIIDTTLEESRVQAKVAQYIFGPTVIQFLIKTEKGVDVRKINSCESNLTMNLEAESIRIQTPVPGKAYAGIEVPKKRQFRRTVYLGDLISNSEFKNSKMTIPVAVGQDNYGGYMYIDIAEMPHCLIAGTTKSGKSVCLNTFLLSLIYRFNPKDMRLVLIDPKRVELSPYNGIPHLAIPVVTDFDKFHSTLSWIVDEMEKRYELFETLGERNIKELNERFDEEKKPRLPYIIVVMDEFSDWITGAGQEIENMLQRIAQKARAAGIHIILAAQRPSKDVIKGSIKANFDTRIAFKVSSFEDSKVILGGSGAEKLEGYGDMLIRYSGNAEKRLQGAFVDNREIKKVINFLKDNNKCDYILTSEELEKYAKASQNGSGNARSSGRDDERFEEFAYFVVRNNNASNNDLGKIFGMGYNRVNDLLAALEELGVVSTAVKGKPRSVLVDEYRLEEILDNN